MLACKGIFATPSINVMLEEHARATARGILCNKITYTRFYQEKKCLLACKGIFATKSINVMLEEHACATARGILYNKIPYTLIITEQKSFCNKNTFVFTPFINVLLLHLKYAIILQNISRRSQ